MVSFAKIRLCGYIWQLVPGGSTIFSSLPALNEKFFFRRLVDRNTSSGHVLGGRAWLTSVTLAVIG